MSIIEFLEARIEEDAELANATLDDQKVRGWGDWREDTLSNGHGMPATDLTAEYSPARVLAECAAKRAIIEQHEDWPVLVEREPQQVGIDPNDLQSMTYRMSREIAWLTQREYVKRFGVEPPTAPMIRTLAAIYKEHPDYRQEWAL